MWNVEMEDQTLSLCTCGELVVVAIFEKPTVVIDIHTGEVLARYQEIANEVYGIASRRWFQFIKFARLYQ